MLWRSLVYPFEEHRHSMDEIAEFGPIDQQAQLMNH
jgi:hypothetical protein